MGSEFSMERREPFTHDTTDLESGEKNQIRKLGDLFGLLGSDPEQNIHTIVRQTCVILDGAYSFYSRVDAKTASLVRCSGYNLPPDFPDKTPASGHICYEATVKSDDRPVVIGDISQTAYQKSDGDVRQYGIKAYLGHPVRCSNNTVRSLAVADTRVRTFNRTHQYLISMLAKALALEEDRLRINAAQRRSKNESLELYKMLRLLADNVPDLLWAKDMQDRYLFANQAMCDKLIKCKHPDDAIGQTDLFFAKRERDRGHQHTFGEICVNSDETIKRKKSAGRFIEEGTGSQPEFGSGCPQGPLLGTSGQPHRHRGLRA